MNNSALQQQVAKVLACSKKFFGNFVLLSLTFASHPFQCHMMLTKCSPLFYTVWGMRGLLRHLLEMNSKIQAYLLYVERKVGNQRATGRRSTTLATH